MATRLYFDTAAPTVSPTPDGSWEVTGSMVRRWLDIGKFAFPGRSLEALAVATALNSPAGAVDALILQAVSPPLSGNQTISGAIKGQIRAFESNAAADLRIQMVIWVRKADGTSRGTLIASDTAALSSEFATSTTNRKAPRGSPATPTTVNALDTDRIVVEIGFRKHENATTSRTGTISGGNPSEDSQGTAYTDLPENETDTTVTTAGWIEFADNLTFAIAPLRVSQVVARVGAVPDAAVRVSQVQAHVAAVPDAAVRVSQVIVKVAVSGAVPVSAAQRTQVIWVR